MSDLVIHIDDKQKLSMMRERIFYVMNEARVYDNVEQNQLFVKM